MSDEKQETRADIIAEMRNLGKLDEKSNDMITRSLKGLGLRTYADRIEAAWKRERDNAAATREALIRARDMLFAWRRDIPFRAWNEIDETIDKCNAALSATSRNCDCLDWREAWDLWIAEKHPQKPQTFNEAYRGTVSFMDWYMSKSEKEGENNGK